MKNNKLYSLYKNEGICRELSNYFSSKDRDYFLNYYLKRIIFNGDYYYYNSKEEEAILNNFYTRNMCNKLIEFQKTISTKGITKAKELYNSTTFNNYIKKLQDVNINPIPIPKNWEIKFLKNPFNFTEKNIYLLEDNYKLVA